MMHSIKEEGLTMTDREKLIEILQYGMDKYFLLNFEAKIFADLLLANGVTVQKWISVKDRLPECDQVVLCHRNGWVTKDAWLGSNWWHQNDVNPITHWMPLPQPPKGE